MTKAVLVFQKYTPIEMVKQQAKEQLRLIYANSSKSKVIRKSSSGGQKNYQMGVVKYN